MTEEDYKQLEALLGKLRTEIGARYGIFPGYINDGYAISTFNEGGELEKQAIRLTIRHAVRKLKDNAAQTA